MKLQKFYILVAGALLIGAVAAQAQTAAFNATAGPFDNLNHDCIAKSQTGSEVLLLNNQDVVVQSFTACTEGFADKAYVVVKQISADGKLAVSIEDTRGNVLDATKIVVKEGDSGVITAKLMAKVEAGMRYNLKLRALNTDLVIEGRYMETPGVDLHLNGWKLDGNISAAVGMFEVSQSDDVAVISGTRNPNVDNAIADRASEFNATFNVYPNPFNDEIRLTFKKALKGETQVVLMDLSGNILHRQILTNPGIGQDLDIVPAYNLHPGAYALRVINDNRIYNQTVMKH